MYLFGLFFSILFLFSFLLYLIFRNKKTDISQKIKLLSECEKLSLLNALITPAGFCYDPEQDIFTSTLDAWQRDFGYTALYDEAAPLTQMVFDCLPVYFDYKGRTWLVELWKGQYGINTGAELGIYQADDIIPPEKYSSAFFHSIPDEELPLMQLELIKNGKPLFRIAHRHWWLTGFCMGAFSDPWELSLKGSITFSACEMTEAFLNALKEQGISRCDLTVRGQTVTISLVSSSRTGMACSRHPLRCRISQRKNELFVRIYHYFTKSFECTPDKLLYLWHLLPPAFRQMIQPRKKKCFRKCKHLRTSPYKRTSKT